MMKKTDITALMKGLQKKACDDPGIIDLFDEIDDVAKAVDELEDDAPRLSLPYVNATPIGGRPWK